MADQSKSKAQLISELKELRQRSARQEVSEAERKHAEEALHPAHARLRATFDAIQENMSIVDLDFYLTDVNDVLIKTFGLSNRESVLGRKCFEVLKGRKDICPNCAVAEVYQSKGPACRTTTPEDEVTTRGRSFEIFAYPIMDENGNISGAVEFARDITNRKQAENALKQSEQRFRAVLEAVPDLMLVLDADGRYREVFTANPDLLYAPVDQLLGKNIHDILPPEDAQRIQEIIDRVLATGELQIYEYQLETGGVERWFAGRSVKFRFEDADCVLWCARDITQPKIAEEALRESEERHRMLLEASPDPIVVYDIEGRATYVNAAFVESFGWSSEELLGERIDFVPEENWPETRTAIARMLRGEKIQSFETRRLTKDGRILDIQLSSSVFHDQGDSPVGNIVILRDVTKRKKAEDALRESEAELAEQSRHLEEVNAALKALLRQRESDKADLEQKLLANIKELVLPYVEKLKISRSYSDRMTLVGILESNVKEIVSPFVTKLSSRFLSLTPTEIQVASLIKDGKTSKEIAVLLNASENTVRSHRFHIRSKLGIKNKKVNLRSYLQSIQD